MNASADIDGANPSDTRRGYRPDLDPITDLPLRRSYRDYLEKTLTQARRQDDIHGLLLIDLDRFKAINDAFGLTFGDRLLKSVAERLRQCVGNQEVVGRLGHDQFAILRKNANDKESMLAFGDHVRSSLDQPFLIDDEELHLTASFGITMFPRDGDEADRLLQNAELAKCQAKSLGRNATSSYAPRMNMAARRKGLLERELRRAVPAGEFTVFYQPCQTLGDRRVSGMEALLRWQHPRRGIVRPTEFIGLAETIGLINPITRAVLDQSCRQHRSWTEAGLPSMRLAVNLSPLQFRDEGVVDLVKSSLSRTGIAPEALEIELTEGVMFENSRVAIDSLARLNELGVTFSLDDFGTGYSSLSQIRHLPVQRLKIDRSFVQRIGRNGREDSIVRTMVDLGHDLGLKVTAEGVETTEQLERLAFLGCDEVQGDLISPPLSAEAFSVLLRQGNV